MKRILGDFGNKNADKLFVCVGSLHGNEPAGWKALKIIFQQLEEHQIQLNGRFIGITGNLTALKENKRLVDHDLNRLWSAEKVSNAQEFPLEKVEHQELVEIHEVYDEIGFERYTEKYFLDLHTTSAENGIFLIVKEISKVQHIANSLKVPVLLGLENQLHDTTVPYMTDLGFLAMGFESGQHDNPHSITNNVTVLWRMLVAIGMLDQEAIPASFLENYYLDHFTNSIPSHMNVDYRHHVTPEDDFAMIPGFKNFDPIEKGQLLAYDKNGEIRANNHGFVLMPLYQKEGKDGFFLTSEITDLSRHITGGDRI
ncbi:MAG: hypothetical protein ACPGJS_01365 [Flammeovirgaceae bacterium]